jgi:hypothetical protein
MEMPYDELNILKNLPLYPNIVSFNRVVLEGGISGDWIHNEVYFR